MNEEDKELYKKWKKQIMLANMVSEESLKNPFIQYGLIDALILDIFRDSDDNKKPTLIRYLKDQLDLKEKMEKQDLIIEQANNEKQKLLDEYADNCKKMYEQIKNI